MSPVIFGRLGCDGVDLLRLRRIPTAAVGVAGVDEVLRAPQMPLVASSRCAVAVAYRRRRRRALYPLTARWRDRAARRSGFGDVAGAVIVGACTVGGTGGA